MINHFRYKYYRLDMNSFIQIFLFIAITVGSIAAQSLDSSAETVEPEIREIAVSTTLSEERVMVGDTFEYAITVVLPGNPVFWLFDSLVTPQTSGLEFVGTATTNEVSMLDGEKTGKATVSLKFSPLFDGDLTMSDGYFRLFNIIDGDTSNIDTVIVRYFGFAVEGIPARKPSPGLFPFFLFIGGLLFAAGLFFIIRYLVQKSRQEPMEPLRPPTPSEQALASLSQIATGRMSVEEIVDTISRIIRDYIVKIFNIPASGMSSGEIIEAFTQEDIGGHRLVELREILKYCDDVRFAEKYPQQSELDEIIEMTKTFVVG